MISLQLLKLFPDMCLTMLMNSPKISKSKGIALHQKTSSTGQGGSYKDVSFKVKKIEN